MKKPNMRVTPSQLAAIRSAGDILSAMIGRGDDDSEFKKAVDGIDRFLKMNGHKRDYK